MQRPSPFLVALSASIALWATSSAVRAAATLVERSDYKALEEAKQLLAKGSFAEALEGLKIAEALPGTSSQKLAEIAALRADALLALPPSPERKAQADGALLQLFHLDAAGSVLTRATFTTQARAQALKSERPVLFHERIGNARLDRPVLVQARLGGAAQAAARVVLHYRLEPDAADQSGSDEEYVSLPLDQQRSGLFEGYLRPGVGGLPTAGDHVLRYYLVALSPDGAVLDSNGSVQAPIRTQISARDAGAPMAGALSVDEGAKRPPVEVPQTPWYKKWQIVAPIGGALVIGAVVAAVLLQPKPQPPSGSLGKVNLP